MFLLGVFLSLFAVGICAESNCIFTHNYTNATSIAITRCVMMTVTADISIRYATNGSHVGFKNVRVPCGNSSHPVNVTGTCDGPHSENTLTVSWGNIGDIYDYELMFTFVMESKKWSISEITAIVDLMSLDDAKYGGIIIARRNSSIIGSISNGRSYQCNSKNNLSLTTEGSDYEKHIANITVTLRDFRVQSFGFKFNDTKAGYGNVARCSQDIKGSKIVLIAVGAALAGLVVLIAYIIVWIVYIIGRLRSHRQNSYEALS